MISFKKLLFLIFMLNYVFFVISDIKNLFNNELSSFIKKHKFIIISLRQNYLVMDQYRLEAKRGDGTFS